MYLEGKPFTGRELERLKQFLRRMKLEYDEGIEYSICILNDEYEIIGTGSVDRNVIKCVAIAPEAQGQGHAAEILSNLIQYEFEKARPHLFIYTKPENLAMFADMGFYTIFETPDVLFMENRSRGFAGYIEKLRKESPAGALDGRCEAGAVVANCNPFTIGHRYLIEQALERCDCLHLFVLSDDRSTFPAEDRYQMVKLGIQGLDRVILHRTSDYMISAATFPTYFFKDQAQGKKANCRLDLELFAARIAPELHIVKRFVGTEPFCKITEAYNREMKSILPAYGIRVEELPRKMLENIPVSASEVRKAIEEKNDRKIRELVPSQVYEYLNGRFF